MYFVSGYPKVILRLEGLSVLLVSLLAYKYCSHSWKAFFIMFFLPDLSMLGYFINKTAGSIIYNIFHSYTSPLILGLVSYSYYPHLQYLTFIWIAHIGFDRMLGFGLKYKDGFRSTHLGHIGKQHPAPSHD